LLHKPKSCSNPKLQQNWGTFVGRKINKVIQLPVRSYCAWQQGRRHEFGGRGKCIGRLAGNRVKRLPFEKGGECKTPLLPAAPMVVPPLSLPSLPSLPRTAARSKLLNANGSNEEKVIITYLNPLLSLR